MRVRETTLEGVFLIDLEVRGDARGLFARSWCKRDFEDHALQGEFVQSNIALTYKKGTVRGLHYQVIPNEEVKLIRCTRGAMYDVVVDLRPESKTYMQWDGFELSTEKYTIVYVPAGCAHGYQALATNTEVSYLVSQFYTPGHERGVRYDDPAFSIAWPLAVSLVSEKDQQWPNYSPQAIENIARDGHNGSGT